MISSHNEKNESVQFNGTIIDLETIGPFANYIEDDSRQYSNITPTIVGYITNNELNIYCAKEIEKLNELRDFALKVVPSFEKPLFAFQSKFERCVLYHAYGLKLQIDGELNNRTCEWKGYACSGLNILAMMIHSITMANSVVRHGPKGIILKPSDITEGVAQRERYSTKMRL